MELKNVLAKRPPFQSLSKCHLVKIFMAMTQCPPNPEFMSIKVQNVDFLKKPSVGSAGLANVEWVKESSSRMCKLYLMARTH